MRLEKQSKKKLSIDKMNKSISVIIPAYNATKTLNECLKAVIDNSYKAHEIIVVSDGSTDNTVEIAKELNCKVIDYKKNKGVSYARNIGAKQAKGEILVFIDSDVKIKLNALKLINDSFSNKEITVVQGLYSHEPNYQNAVTQYQQSFYSYYLFNVGDFISTLVGCCFAIRKSVFVDSGGFNEKSKYGGEDEEFGYLLQNKGYKIRVLNGLNVEHMIHYTFLKYIKREFVIYTNYARNLFKNKAFKLKIKQNNYNGAFLSLFLMGLIGLNALSLLIIPNVYTLGLLIALNVLFIISKLKFLKFIYNSKGLKKAIPCLLVCYLDSLLICISMVYGISSYYILGDKD